MYSSSVLTTFIVNVPFTADQQYLDCLCPNPQFQGSIAQCYSCVGQYKREGGEYPAPV